jgi:adenylate cyclase
VPSDQVEHRLAAVLSADVVGYSRMMSEDEAGTIRILSSYREQIGVLVQQHRGRVVDSPGDNLLAEFPSAIDAVRGAVAIQRVLQAQNADLPADRRMEFRIGIHMGDIAVAGDRVYGDGVNIAARLEGLAEAGGICISATVHEQVRNKVEVRYDDLGDQAVKNLPDQVHVFRVTLSPGEGPARAPERGRSRARTVGIAALGLVGLVALGLWASWPRPLGWLIDAAGLTGPGETPALPDQASIVVLPFANMSGDADQEYFSDGITEDLTTDLSRSPFLFVISRNSAFIYKDRQVKPEDVGRELGVRYVLEGSVRKAGDRVRITAQLIDATTGFHIWSERYDRDLSDIFAVQSEISEEIQVAVGVEINAAETERVRAKPTENLTAYDSFMRALYHLNRFTKKDNLEARRLAERAVEQDPSYAAPIALIGATYALETGFGWNVDRTLLDRAEQYVRRALQLSPDLVNGFLTMAAVNLFRGNPADAAPAAARAIELAPNLAVGHFFYGMAQAQQGNFISATRSIKRALRLNPRAESGYKTIVGYVNFAAGREEEAVAVWERLRAANPDLLNALIPLVAYYQQVGREEDARTVAQEILRVNPDLTAEAAVYATAGGLSEEGVGYLRAAGLP